jgi:hypothetical protein
MTGLQAYASAFVDEGRPYDGLQRVAVTEQERALVRRAIFDLLAEQPFLVLAGQAVE